MSRVRIACLVSYNVTGSERGLLFWSWLSLNIWLAKESFSTQPARFGQFPSSLHFCRLVQLPNLISDWLLGLFSLLAVKILFPCIYKHSHSWQELHKITFKQVRQKNCLVPFTRSVPHPSQILVPPMTWENRAKNSKTLCRKGTKTNKPNLDYCFHDSSVT